MCRLLVDQHKTRFDLRQDITGYVSGTIAVRLICLLPAPLPRSFFRHAFRAVHWSSLLLISYKRIPVLRDSVYADDRPLLRRKEDLPVCFFYFGSKGVKIRIESNGRLYNLFQAVLVLSDARCCFPGQNQGLGVMLYLPKRTFYRRADNGIDRFFVLVFYFRFSGMYIDIDL